MDENGDVRGTMGVNKGFDWESAACYCANTCKKNVTANIQNLLDYSMDLIALLAPPTHAGTRRSGALNVSSVTRCEYLRKLKSS